MFRIQRKTGLALEVGRENHVNTAQHAAGQPKTERADQCVFRYSEMQQRASRQVVRRLAEFGDLVLGDKPGEAYA
jgi:hypothetical protein